MGPGEVWQIRFPQTGGREQAGDRPALILQDESYARRSPLVMTIPFTTSPGPAKYPAVVPVAATAANGLTADSLLLVFQLRATDRNRIGRKLGDVSPQVLTQVYNALDRLTGRSRPTPGSPP